MGRFKQPGQDLHECRDESDSKGREPIQEHSHDVDVELHRDELGVQCAVAYDTFLGASASGTNLFEVMVWLGVYGGVSPLSANGYPFTPIASPTINGVAFDLAYGTNGNVKVYSFVAHSHAATPFSGDLLAFYQYLATNYGSNGFTSSLVLQSVQAGSEVFTGTNADLTTTAYTISAS
ncbi:MAG: hypothetical protein M1821_007391 [Bathelium mastoideum]|nr:MAG: hypothetical protein M1821_007391 [Bathelium mastoideum]